LVKKFYSGDGGSMFLKKKKEFNFVPGSGCQYLDDTDNVHPEVKWWRGIRTMEWAKVWPYSATGQFMSINCFLIHTTTVVREN
jgi:hypothetical protein